MKRAPLVAVALLLGACASPAPSAPPPASAEIPTPLATVRVDDWTATCAGVPADDCQGVAALFVNNLARNSTSVLDESGGQIRVTSRPQCPALPDWADPSACWQATAEVAAGPICMVIARHPREEGAASTFGQVGGDDMTSGQVLTPSAWPTCQ